MEKSRGTIRDKQLKLKALMQEEAMIVNPKPQPHKKLVQIPQETDNGHVSECEDNVIEVEEEDQQISSSSFLINGLDFTELTSDDDEDVLYVAAAVQTNTSQTYTTAISLQDQPSGSVGPPPPPPLPPLSSSVPQAPPPPPVALSGQPAGVPPPPPLPGFKSDHGGNSQSQNGPTIRKLHFWTPKKLKQETVRKARGSIWKDVPRIKVPPARFSQLFSEAPVELKSREKKGKVSTVLTSDRSKKVTIETRQLESPEKIQGAIVSMDDSYLKEEMVEKLSRLMPDEEELKLIKEKKAICSLTKEEHFLHTLASTPEVSERLSLLKFRCKFQRLEEEIAASMEVVKNAIGDIKESQTFKQVLGTLLSIGNFLNGKKDSDEAFELEFIKEVNSVKDTTAKGTQLLVHIVELTVEKFPESTDLYSELPNVHKVTQGTWKETLSIVEELREDLAHAREHLEAIQITRSKSLSVWEERMDSFDERIKVIEVVKRRVVNRLNRLYLYLGIKPENRKVDLLCTLLSDFSKMYCAAHGNAVISVLGKGHKTEEQRNPKAMGLALLFAKQALLKVQERKTMKPKVSPKPKTKKKSGGLKINGHDFGDLTSNDDESVGGVSNGPSATIVQSAPVIPTPPPIGGIPTPPSTNGIPIPPPVGGIPKPPSTEGIPAPPPVRGIPKPPSSKGIPAPLGGGISSSSTSLQPTKKLHWDPLKIQQAGTIWEKLPKVDVPCDKFSNLFARKQSASKKEKSPEKKKTIFTEDREKKIKVEIKPLQSVERIQRAIVSMKYPFFNREMVEKLIRVLPTEEERELIVKKAVSDRTKEEVFVFTLKTTPQVADRLSLLKFHYLFQQVEEDTADILLDTMNAIKCVKTSRTFKQVLGAILAVGNFLNDSKASAFELDYLSKVTSVKDATGKGTLMFHLVELVIRKYPDSTDLYTELTEVHKVAKIKWDEAKSPLSKLQDDLTKCQVCLKAITQSGPLPICEKKLNSASRRLKVLTTVQRRVENRVNRLYLFVGMDATQAKGKKVEAFCKLVSDFSMAYRTTYGEVLKKLENSRKSLTQGEELDLNQAIKETNIEGVTESMNELNKWNVKLEMWQLNLKMSLLEGKAHLQEVEDDLEELKKKKSFLEKCCAIYEEEVVADDEHATVELSFDDDNQTPAFEELFHTSLPDDFVIDVGSKFESPYGDDDSMLDKNQLSDSPYLKFHKSFRQFLNEKYGHMPEELLFGEAFEGDSSTVLLLDHFKTVEKCKNLDQFMAFFSDQLLPHQSRTTLSELQTCFSELYDEMSGDNKAVQLRKLLVDQVAIFCFYLIDSRMRTMKALENLERELHKKFTGYEFLSNVESNGVLKRKFQEFLNDIRKLEEDYEDAMHNGNSESFNKSQRSVYRRQIELYKSFLKYLKQQRLIESDEPHYSNVESILSDPNKNHFSYLHEHIYHLGRLLLPFEQRYTVTSTDTKDGVILSVKMEAGTVSGALSELSELLTKKDQPHEIRLHADTALYGDRDVSFQGVNIVYIAPKMTKVKQSGQVRIITDGKPLVGKCQTAGKADNGDNGTEDNKQGGKGKNGRDGDYGNAGGHILLVANDLCSSDFSLSAIGSSGEDGQDGGDGGNGWSATRPGRDGQDREFGSSWWILPDDLVMINYGTRGDFNYGGPGGDPGLGGAPGKSGSSGKIELLDLKNTENCKVTQDLVEDGRPGKQGKVGKGGRNTKHGMDFGATSTAPSVGGWFANLFSLGLYDSRKVNKVWGDLEHYAINYCPGSGYSSVVKASGSIRKHKPSDHPDYDNVRCGKKRDGQESQAEAKTNPALANDKKVINKHACFQALHKQCEQSLQHWNAQSHSQFLGSFAQKIGDSFDSSKFVVNTHCDRFKENSAIWIERIQKQSEEMQSRVSVVHHTKHTTRAQVMLMKDFDDSTIHPTEGYLSSAKDTHKEILLDVSPLVSAKHLGVQQNSLSMENLMLGDKLDKLVEQLSQLKQPQQTFILIGPNVQKTSLVCDFLIVKLSNNTFRYHQQNEQFQINDSDVLNFLKSKTITSVPVEIERDDYFYPKMIAIIHRQLGDETNVPFTSKQFLCLQQLQFLVAIRKSYHLIGGKCQDTSELEAIRKLFGQYVDEVLGCESVDVLTDIQNNMLNDKMLILPLETSWIDKVTLRDKAVLSTSSLCNSVDAFNRHPNLTDLLDVFMAFFGYHMDRLAQPTNRFDYLLHLKTSEYLGGLNRFCNQLCSALQIFCSAEHIDKSLQNVPRMASSETILHQMSLLPVSSHSTVLSHCQRKLLEVCEKQPLICTIVDQYLENLVEHLKINLEIEIPRLKMPFSLPEKFTFKESFAAFETMPCVQTITAAFSVYVSSIALNPPTQCVEQLQDLFESLYTIVNVIVTTFDVHITHDSLVTEIQTLGVKPDKLYEMTKVIFDRLSKQNSLYSSARALIHILKQLQSLMTLSAKKLVCNDEKFNEQKSDPNPKLLLVNISHTLEDLHDFCKKALKLIANNDKSDRMCTALRFHRQCLTNAYNSSLLYPIATRVSILMMWKQHVTAIQELVQQSNTSKDKGDKSVTVREELDKLKILLECCASINSTLEDINVNLGWIKLAKSLKHFSELHLSDEDGKGKLLIHWQLGLDKRLFATSCMNTLHAWLCRGQQWQSPQHFIVVTHRLMPNHDVIIQSKEPKENIHVNKPTIYLYPSKHDVQWESAFKKPDSSPIDFRGVDITDNDLQKLLPNSGEDIHEHLRKRSRLDDISEDMKAHLLGKLRYEEEFTIVHTVLFDDQQLVYEVNAAFSLVVVKTQTSEVKFHRSTDLTKMDFKIKDDDLLIVQGQCNESTNKALKKLLVHVEDLSHFRDASAFCLVRHPGQPPMLQTVSECGDIVEHKFVYQLPLITILNSTENQTFSEQLEPLSDTLNSCVQLHHSMDVLDSSLQATLKKQRVTLYYNDILKLVHSLRCCFIEECFAAIAGSCEPRNIIKAMQQPLKCLMTHSGDHPIITEMYLTGLESFSNFLLQQVKESKNDIAKAIGSMTKVDLHQQMWQKVLQMKTLTKEDAECLYMAYFYLKESDDINDLLQDETVLFRLQLYQSIAKGLRCFEYLCKPEFTDRKLGPFEARVKKSLDQITAYQRSFQIDALQEASVKIEADDTKKFQDLLRMLQSGLDRIKPLREELVKHLAEEPLQEDPIQAGIVLLKDSRFYSHISEMVLCWCIEQQKKLISSFQSVVSDTTFAHSTKSGVIVNTVSDWLMEKTKPALSEHRWVDLLLLYEVGDEVCEWLKSRVRSLKNRSASQDEFSDLLSECLTLVQVIDASRNLESVWIVLQSRSSEEWVTNIFVLNLTQVCVEHFEIESAEEEALIQEKLTCIDPKLLQISYNVFLDDQYHQTNEQSQVGMISYAQLMIILDWLPYIEPDSAACSTLCKTAMSMWEKVLSEIHFKQYLDHWHGLTESDKICITYLLNRVRLDAKSNFMSFLSVIKGKYISSGSKDSSPLVNLVMDLYYKSFSLLQANDVIQKYEYKQWPQHFTALKTPNKEKRLPRSFDEVLQLIEEQIHSHGFQLSADELASIERECMQITHEIDAVELKCKQSHKPTLLIKEQLKVCADKLETLGKCTIAEKLEWLKCSRVEFVVHIIKAWMCASKMQRPYNTQLVSLLLFLHIDDDQGLLQQVKTGEGKTLIVGMLSAAKALLGFHVDVVSSNRDLAEDGVRKCEKFFNILGLEAAVNCTDDDDTNQQAYKKQIVYGDVGSFQRDVLTEETSSGESQSESNFSRRYSKLEECCLIVDEVDSMFLDKGRHMLYLSHESPALKHLESLFLVIWSSVLSINPEEHDEQLYIDAMLEQMATDLNMLIQKKQVSVPAYLIDFCDRKMQSWVRSAYQARFMDANDQFVLDHRSKDEGDAAKQIFPVDKQTGIEEYNMKWSNGLSQFLELKYRRKLSSESLKAIFISNKRFFKRYGTALYGLTGTLGSPSSRKLLREVYQVSTVELPTNKAKQYIQHNSHVAIDSDGWCQVIHEEVCKRRSQQPVLIICENIKRLNSLKEHFEQGDLVNIEIIDYARDGDDVEKRFEGQGSAMPNQIVLATNKGGRGTDIKINVKKVPKGLHVIVSFLPENTRIEEQAFGRAARAGQAGSGCLVVQIDPDEYESEIKMLGTATGATEALIEMEKLKRDQAESDRISLLLNEGIPQLDLEEGLYQSFQEQKKQFESTLTGATLNGEPIIGKTMDACIAILIDHWAYWLDSASQKIRAADSSEKRMSLKEDFNKTFLELTHSSPSLSDHCKKNSKFFAMPEHCIELGQAYLKQEKVSAARYCFEKAIDRGDCTGLAAMAACYCYVKSNPKPSEYNKKEARRYLKKAKSRLDELRRRWMANAEIGKSLVELVDVSQYVDQAENHYTEQVEDKLKVIGLHLNTLETLLGRDLDETSFINKSAPYISEEDSREIFDELVKEHILCQHKVRSCWRNRTALKRIIDEEVDENIADDLVNLIVKRVKKRIDVTDLKKLVFSSDELWRFLLPQSTPSEPIILLEPSESDKRIILLELTHIDGKLKEDSLKESWQSLKESFPDKLNSTTSVVLHKGGSIHKILQTTQYERLMAHLKSNGLYRETRRAQINRNAIRQLNDSRLGRYRRCTVITDESGKKQSLCEFLIALLEHCCDHEGGFCYEYMLPFDSQEVETKKLHAFLQEKDILKSGVLTLFYDNDVKGLTSAVEEALSGISSESQKAFVVNVLQGTQGEIRGFTRDMLIGFDDFYELKDRPDDVPETLTFFDTWYLDQFLTLKEKEKGWWDWNAFAVAMLGLAQVIAGAALVVLTVGAASQVGSALIAEGINDMVYATIAGITGTFSWKDWAIQKAISVAISIATGGLGLLAAPAKVAAKVGSASRFCTFAKTMLKAAGEFVLTATASLITDVLLDDVQQRVVTSIVDKIESLLFSEVDGALKAQLKTMAEQEAGNRAKFRERCHKLKGHIRKTLKQDSALPEEFDQLRSRVASSLQQSYKRVADSLSQCESKWAKLAGKATKAAVMANQIYEGVQIGVNAVQAVNTLVGIVGNFDDKQSHSSGSRQGNGTPIDQTTIDDELEEIKQIFKQCIQDQIRKKLKGVLENIIKGSMRAVAKAGKKAVSSMVKQTFNGRTTATVVKDMQDKKKKPVVISDFDEQDEKSPSSKRDAAKASTDIEKKQREYKQRREGFQDSVLKPQEKGRQKDLKDHHPDDKPGAKRKSGQGHPASETHSHGPSTEQKAKAQLAVERSKETKLPTEHTVRPGNKSTGYQYARGEELERAPMRERSKSQAHLELPASVREHWEESLPPPKRRATNCPLDSIFQTQQQGRVGKNFTQGTLRTGMLRDTQYRSRIETGDGQHADHKVELQQFKHEMIRRNDRITRQAYRELYTLANSRLNLQPLDAAANMKKKKYINKALILKPGERRLGPKYDKRVMISTLNRNLQHLGPLVREVTNPNKNYSMGTKNIVRGMAATTRKRLAQVRKM